MNAGEYNNANYIQHNFYDQVVKEQNYYSLPADLMETRNRNAGSNKLKEARMVDGSVANDNPLDILAKDPQFKAIFEWRKPSREAPGRRSKRRQSGHLLDEGSAVEDRRPVPDGEEVRASSPPMGSTPADSRLFMKRARK